MEILVKESYVDKSQWPRGEWDDEPDKIEWRSNTPSKLPCLIVRGPVGALCGYVGINKDHPYYEKDYNEVDVEVHGGLTFGNKCQEGGRICHKPLAGESDHVYWLGFDCSHCYDFSPSSDGNLKRLRYPGEERVYRNINYIINQVNNLAEQLDKKLNKGD